MIETNARSGIFKVWFFEPDSSVERAVKHPDEIDLTEILSAYEAAGREVIQVRHIANEREAGDVVYHNPRF